MTCTVDRALKAHCLSICCILSLCLSRSEVLRSLRHYLWAQSQGYHNTDHLEKRHRKRKPSTVFCEWNTHHQFDQHWNCLEGNVLGTHETGWSTQVFPNTWIQPWTELQYSADSKNKQTTAAVSGLYNLEGSSTFTFSSPDDLSSVTAMWAALNMRFSTWKGTSLLTGIYSTWSTRYLASWGYCLFTVGIWAAEELLVWRVWWSCRLVSISSRQSPWSACDAISGLGLPLSGSTRLSCVAPR